jgi:hypothetical protein
LALAEAGFSLEIRPVGSLRPHERTIPAHVDRIAAEITKDGVQRDPIIIDAETGAVLDGMHRLAAFGKMQIDSAVCCAVDYASRAVSVSRWARVYATKGSGQAADLLKASGLARRVGAEDALAALDRSEAGLAALNGELGYLAEESVNLAKGFEIIDELDRLAAEGGAERTFVPEEELRGALQDKMVVVVIVRKLRKSDVSSAAGSGRLFPCKTSMHYIDPRPVAVNFPVPELGAATTQSLRSRLRGREERILPGGSVYEGRRYKERLLMLSPE